MPSQNADFETLMFMIAENEFEKVKKFFQERPPGSNNEELFDMKKPATKSEEGGDTLLMNRFYQDAEVKKNVECSALSVEMTQLLFNEIKRAKPADDEGKAFLKKQLSHKLNDGFFFFAWVCFTSSSTEVVQLTIDTLVDVGGEEFLKEQLDATFEEENNLLTVLGFTERNIDKDRLLFNTMKRVCGKEFLLKKLLQRNATRKHHNMLDIVGEFYCDENHLPLLVNTLIDCCAGSKDAAKAILTEFRSGVFGFNFLGLVCQYAESLKVIEFAIETLRTLGGDAMVKEQLMFKSDKYSNQSLLSQVLKAENCDVFLFVVKTIIAFCGKDQLLHQVNHVNSNGKVFLPRFGFKGAATLLFALGLFKDQYEKLDDDVKEALKSGDNVPDNNWTPDADYLAKVKAAIE